MDTIITTLVTAGLTGGPQAIVAILFFVIGGLWLDRNRMSKELARKDDRIEKLVDAYHSGNLTLTEALTGLKMALLEMKSQL